MVKGISRQVIVVHSPDPKLFEQAIFILRDEAIGTEGVTEDKLLREAKRLISSSQTGKKKINPYAPAVWAGFGAIGMGLLWILSVLV